MLIAAVALSTLVYGTASADLVPCGDIGSGEPPCQIGHIRILIRNIFDLILKISIALAILCITIGGGLILLQGFNASFLDLGKTFIKSAIIGILIIFLSWIIVNAIFTTLGGPPLPPNP